ncbi:MAG: 2-hydroxyacid dehydrogenase [Acidimicrobiales bacterium]
MGTFYVSVPDDSLATALLALGVPENVRVLEWDMTGPAPRAHLDVVVPPYMSLVSSLRHLEGVTTRLIQSQSIGYDGVAEILDEGRVFANAASVHEASTAELALGLILASQRGIDDFVRAAQEGRWAPAWHQSLADRTVLLVGYGGVARAIEERLVPFEVEILRVARTARRDERGEVAAVTSLGDLLPRADVVVVAVPLSDETTRLVDARFLAAMPDHSLLVNVARGRVANTDAILVEAVTGRLRFALDVTDPEPLPAGHPLFALDNVLISPHVGGATSAMRPRMVRLLADQIARLVRGEAPRNVVLG